MSFPMSGFVRASLLGPCLAATALAVATPAGIDNAALANEADGANWAAYGRGFSEQHYSPLRQINASNVSRLGLAWSLDLSFSNFTTTAPLEVDGVIYFSPGVSEVHAVDARSGKERWRYDPEVYKVADQKMRTSWGTRGLAFWKGKVYLGTRDGRLIAINAKTGKPVWSVMTVDPDDHRYITGAPRVFNGKVIIGHGGGEYGATRGYVTAYDAESGKPLWRFYTVPGDPARGFESPAMELAAKTWNGEWWRHGGGGAVWNAMTYDAQFNRIYIGTGNGAPWNQKIRSPGGGDNLFICSIVALDADTGNYVWHYQVNPGDTWDFDASLDIELATLDIAGKPRQVILHASKSGFFYVIDRATGKLISAQKFGHVTWAERIDLATGRPVETPNARLPAGEALIWPGPTGAHDWQPMSFNRDTGLVYIPVIDLPGLYSDKGIDPARWKAPKDVEAAFGFNADNTDTPMNAGSSALVAWNPVQQKAVWSVPTPGIQAGGTMTTAGNLVFQGQMDGRFKAYAADSGKPLWSFYMANGVLAPPITYSVGGRQYVSVLTGVNGQPSIFGSPVAQFGWQARVHAKRLLTFVIDGKAELAASAPPAPVVPLDDPQFKIDTARAEKGKELFLEKLCSMCHGFGAIAGGGAPDLRASPLTLSPETFAQVVQGGILQARGMPRYPELSDADLQSLIHYLRARARESLAATNKPQ
ncbi:MAG: quinohemoprotein ethanol dehydrogenase [Gammaproteobacteria bacterium]|jgi:quinohemoprotein ethanol dehydrogenase|nr:quinohemoprotein ethanol dehydrogenase [Gammaproteobacteria bacterium]